MAMDTESLRTLLGPVVPYLDDDSVSEILINGADDVWIERAGRLINTDSTFTEESLVEAAQAIAQLVGQQLSDQQPRLDARTPDGTRIHVVMPPVTPRGATIAIRKPSAGQLSAKDLLTVKVLTPPMVRLIEAAIELKLNIVVAGGSGSGRTTLLNAIASLIPDDERVLTIDSRRELKLERAHVVALESPPSQGRESAVDPAELLSSALALRPDRVVIGELRGPSCFQLMQALNAGQGVALASCHASTPIDALRQLESMCLLSAGGLPLLAVRSQVASAIHLIICCERLPDRSQWVTAISEVLPLDERGDFRTHDLFVFTPVLRTDNGEVVGYHSPTGLVPSFAARARAHGLLDLDERFFDPATYDLPAPPAARLGQGSSARWAPSLRHREKGIPDPDSLQEKWAAWEKKLRAARGKAEAIKAAQGQAAPPIPRNSAPPTRAQPVSPATPRQKDTLPPAPARVASDLEVEIEIDSGPHPQPGSAVARRESKVELSPDLLAELDSLGVTLDLPPAQPVSSARPRSHPSPSKP